MLQITESNSEFKAIEVNVRADTGIADVWLRKNIESYTDDEGGERWTAQEAYMQYGYFDGLEAAIEENFDVYFGVASEWVPSVPMTDEQWRASIEECLMELSEAVYGE